jgi:carboxymethylenebutenolidase
LEANVIERNDVKITSADGGEFDCYLALPKAVDETPAVVLACAVYGVDTDLRQIADELAEGGYIAAAPDLFWRTIPGPLPHDDKRCQERSQPRLQRIREGERDMADTLTHIRTLLSFNGRAAAFGFCYGGPYAILGPKRLGYDVGITCHATQMLDYIQELESVLQPICIMWGDRDHRAPKEVLDEYKKLAARMNNVELHVFPGIQHSYMMPSSKAAYDPPTRTFSMQRAFAILNTLQRPNTGRASVA